MEPGIRVIRGLACAGLVLFLAQQPGPAIAKALIYALLAWAGAGAIVLLVYFMLSLDDVRDVLRASLLTSSAGMWLAPALLLLSMREPAAVGAGLLLIANTMRLLFSRSAPRERGFLELPPRRVRPGAIFQHVAPPPAFARETLPVILGAVSLQVGIGLAGAGFLLAGAGLVACGAAVLTWAWFARGAARERTGSSTRVSLLSVLLTLLLATALSVGRIAETSRAENTAGFLATTSRLLDQLAHAPDPKRPGARPTMASLVRPVPKVKKFTPNKNQVPGVILRPDSKERQRALALRPGGRALALAGPMTFPFTGEYHLFPTSSGGVQRDSVVHRGTPLDFLYASASGGTVETEAYQPFDPPFDFGGCGKILLKIASGETTPASASMELEIGGASVEIGMGIFGMERASEETLVFELPAVPRKLTASAMRVIFRRNPMESERTTKVAIQGFTIVPRGS